MVLKVLVLVLVFSTYVEVFPRLRLSKYLHACFLHVCGGVSNADVILQISNAFSPRMWRCF